MKMNIPRAVVQIDGQSWVVVSSTRRRKVLQAAENQIHLARLRLGLTQIECADRLKLSQSTMCRMETGLTPIPEPVIERINEMLAANK